MRNQFLHKLTGHLNTINHHKYLVTKTCFKVGLYWQGITHDLSKYSPIEFIPGVKYYQGNRSPINAEKEENVVSYGWLHHKGRNRHHFEYWIDYSIDKGAAGGSGNGPEAAGKGSESGPEADGRNQKPVPVLVGMKMPKRYVAEMVIDRMSASKNYQKDNYVDAHPLEYYMRGLGSMLIHPETEYLTRYLLTMLAEKGEAYTLKYMKNRLLRHPDRDYHIREGRLYLD